MFKMCAAAHNSLNVQPRLAHGPEHNVRD